MGDELFASLVAAPDQVENVLSDFWLLDQPFHYFAFVDVERVANLVPEFGHLSNALEVPMRTKKRFVAIGVQSLSVHFSSVLLMPHFYIWFWFGNIFLVTVGGRKTPPRKSGRLSFPRDG
ncbi:MAG: hypothetical protein Q8R92_01675 [Deltaproteobacteria bacterium]|nr:hypothetical protein [Deltaproteobacteria bacterium]